MQHKKVKPLGRGELKTLAEGLVEAWHHEISRHGSLSSTERTPLDDKIDYLRGVGLCGGKFKLRDGCHGSPIMLNGGSEITFNSLGFAREVARVLSVKRYYKSTEILESKEVAQ